MGNMKYIGTFYSVDTLLYKITQLQAQGYEEQDFYAVTNMKDTIAMLCGQTAIELQDSNNGNWKNKFGLFLVGQQPISESFFTMGFSEQQARTYYDEVKAGGVALFVEESSQNRNKERDEMDSSVEQGLSGELLDGQDEQLQTLDNDRTVPRINTDKL